MIKTVKLYFGLETVVPPDTTSGPLLTAEIPLLLYVGVGTEVGTGRLFRSKSEGTSEGGGLGGR